MKKINYLLPAVFICFITAVFCCNLGNIKTSAAAQLNKIRSGQLAEATMGFETSLNDSFDHKLSYVYVNSCFKNAMGQKLINNTVKDSAGNVYDIEVTEEVFDCETEKRNLAITEKILDTAASQGAYTLYVQHPDKFGVSDGTLPYGLECIRNERDDYYVAALTADGYNVLDLREDEFSDTHAFFDTDHHWTIESAFNANAHILNKISRESGLISNKEEFEALYSVENYNTEIYEDSFLGSNGIRMIPWSGKEDFTEFFPANDTSFTYCRYSAGDVLSDERTGDFEQAYVRKDLLEATSYLNKYDTYLNEGTYENISVNHNAPNDLKVLLISDSFSRPLHAFMSNNFCELRSLDPQNGRYNESFVDYISEYDPDIVIIMYDYGYFGNSVE